MTQASDFSGYKTSQIFGINFLQEILKLAMIKTMRLNEVHSWHNFHNMFKIQSFATVWLLVEDAAKSHVKFWNFFCTFLIWFYPSNLFPFQTYLEPLLLLSFSVLSRAAQVPLWLPYDQNKISPVVLPCKLVRLVSFSTTSEYSVMPRMSSIAYAIILIHC